MAVHSFLGFGFPVRQLLFRARPLDLLYTLILPGLPLPPPITPLHFRHTLPPISLLWPTLLDDGRLGPHVRSESRPEVIQANEQSKCIRSDGPVLSQTDLYLLQPELQLNPIMTMSHPGFHLVFNLQTGAHTPRPVATKLLLNRVAVRRPDGRL